MTDTTDLSHRLAALDWLLVKAVLGVLAGSFHNSGIQERNMQSANPLPSAARRRRGDRAGERER
jgi:hypothetical protein